MRSGISSPRRNHRGGSQLQLAPVTAFSGAVPPTIAAPKRLVITGKADKVHRNDHRQTPRSPVERPETLNVYKATTEMIFQRHEAT